MEEEQWLAHNIVSFVLNLPGQQVALPCGHQKPWEVACGRVVVLLVWGSQNLSACGRIMLLKEYVLSSLCSPPNSFTEGEDEKMGARPRMAAQRRGLRCPPPRKLVCFDARFPAGVAVLQCCESLRRWSRAARIGLLGTSLEVS